ncbi:VWA domain-containing protein [Streptomyces sp. NPDC006309]|uniref:VWA domain-containing protein n=1 Tax=Streptomyces sp. NPDC006309 TaxID=3156749 RepID=UPI0033BE956A
MTVAEETEVTLAVGQHKELPAVPDDASGRRPEQEMHAILEIGVRSRPGPQHTGAPAPGTGPALAEVLIVDTSRSMLHPAAKLHAAKDATAAAVRMLPDGTAFAVLSGRFDATLVHPGPGRPVLAVAGPAEREAAERAVRILDADGGTALGTWLDLARRLLKDHPAPVKHVLLLTDGRNEHDHRAAMALDTALDACEGRFVCDAWGIGDDWDAELLLRITRRLHGRAHAVRAESELTSAYEELMAGLLGTAVPELRIRLTPTPGTVIRQVKQVVPAEQDLPAVPAGSGGRAVEYVTRAWGDEVRHFQVVLTADPAGRETDEDLQLAAVEVVLPGFGRPVRLPAPQPVLVRWTDNPRDASRQHPGVRRHERYQQAGAAVARAYRAWLRGPDGSAMADRALTQALALADELGDAQLRDALRRIEATPGTGRIRPGLKDVDWQHLILSSALTTPPARTTGGGAYRAGAGDASGTPGDGSGVPADGAPAARGAAPGSPRRAADGRPGNGGEGPPDGDGNVRPGPGLPAPRADGADGPAGDEAAVPPGLPAPPTAGAPANPGAATPAPLGTDARVSPGSGVPVRSGAVGRVSPEAGGSAPPGVGVPVRPGGGAPAPHTPDDFLPPEADDRPSPESEDPPPPEAESPVPAGTGVAPSVLPGGPGAPEGSRAPAVPALPVRADGLVECPGCRWLGPAESVYCGGACGRRLREMSE